MTMRRPISKRVRFAVFRRDHFTCQYCGACAPDARLEVDHRLAAANGGSDDESNLVTACRECNSGKRDGYCLTASKSQMLDEAVVEVHEDDCFTQTITDDPYLASLYGDIIVT